MRYTLTIRETHLPHHNTQCTALINCASTPNSISSLPYATSYVPSYHVKRKVKGCDLRYMALALKREHTTYRSLLMLAGAAVADPELMLARLVRGCIAMSFAASVAADQSSHRLAHTVKGGELSYMALALKREHTTYRSLLMLAGAAVADPELMLARLVRAAVSPWPSLLAWPLLYMHPPRQGRLHKRQERKIGEPAAYQASLHRSDFGMDSFWPPEQRAVHGIHAYTRWPHAATSPSRMVVDAFDKRAVAHAGGMQAKASPTRTRRADIGSSSARTGCSRLSTELHAVGSRAIAISMQPHPRQGYMAKVVDGGLLLTLIRLLKMRCRARWPSHCPVALGVAARAQLRAVM